MKESTRTDDPILLQGATKEEAKSVHLKTNIDKGGDSKVYIQSV